MVPLFLVVFGSVNLYVVLRGWEWVRALSPAPALGWLYWPLCLLLVSAFPFSRLAAARLPRGVTKALVIAGAYWLSILQYAVLLLILLDVGRLLNRWFGVVPPTLALDAVRWLGGGVALALVGLVLYGIWRARTPIVTRYEVSIPKSGGKHAALHVVLVSDTHLGQINGTRRLRPLVEMVNGLEPDLILLAGDLLDDDFEPFVAEDMPTLLRALKARIGVYGVVGNHDYLTGHSAEYRQHVERAGIHLLVDERALVDESFYVIGRDDISGRAHGVVRKPLAELLRGVNTSRPLILMDHQPYRLEEAEQLGVDLQVSGHTHRGQMFPYQYITRRIFELDWGYLRKGGLHVVVSSGFGTWGPPLRIGNKPEVVSIRVQFTG